MSPEPHTEQLRDSGVVAGIGSERVHQIKSSLTAQNATGFSDFDRLLWKQETVADFLAVDRTTIWRWVEAGRIARVELLPGLHRFRTSDVRAFSGLASRADFETLIDISTAAWLLSVDRTTLWRLRQIRSLEAVVLSQRSVRIRYTDLKLLAQNGTSPLKQRAA